MFKTFFKVASLALSTFILPSNALAWGADGHKTIALIAQSQLTPKALTEVDRLLALESESTLESISTWADEHRNPATAAWHYVNFPRETCTYVPERECPDGKCVVGAIQRQLETLASSAPDEKRLTALKYVVHFAGDVHQPLHAGYADDRGGNQYQLQAFMRGTNLHALWDSGIIKSLNESPEVLAGRLLNPKTSFPVNDLDPVHAAEESCMIVGMPGYYPDRSVGQDYIDRFTPVMEQRLVTAGRRLAGLLNKVFR